MTSEWWALAFCLQYDPFVNRSSINGWLSAVDTGIEPGVTTSSSAVSFLLAGGHHADVCHPIRQPTQQASLPPRTLYRRKVHQVQLQLGLRRRLTPLHSTSKTSFPSRPWLTHQPLTLVSLRHITHPFFAFFTQLWCVHVYVYKISTSIVRVHHCTDW